MKKYDLSIKIRTDDTINYCIDHIKMIKEQKDKFSHKKHIKSVFDYLEEDFENIDKLLSNYYDFRYLRKRRIIQNIVNISDYCVNVINENLDKKTDYIIKFEHKNLQNLRLKKIDVVMTNGPLKNDI